MTKPNTERRRFKRLHALRISTLVFLLAGALIALATTSLVFVGHIASKEADEQAAANELRLFDNALRDRFLLIARDQLSVARWDRAVQNVVLAFDKAYIRDELVDSLWYDYGHERTYFVAPGGTVLAEAARDTVDFSGRRLREEDDVRRIAEEATRRHGQHRISIPGGFGQMPVPRTQIDRIAALGFAHIDGRAALVSAMAIVPDDGVVALPGTPPVILVSAKFIDAELTGDLNAQLAFRDLAFSEGAVTDGSGAAAGETIVSLGGKTLGRFTWASARPGAHIWSVIVPVILGLGALLAIAAFSVARQIGGLSTQLEGSEARNRHLARHDALTGLANRLQFDAVLEAAAAALPARPFAVIACDLDRFKAVNDTYGHAGGDTVIRTVAARLSEAVGATGLVCRVGGDEFVIVMDGFTDRQRLSLLSHHVIAAVSAPIDLDEHTSTDVGVSLGIAVAPQAAATGDAILAAADAALYEAKERGRGCAVFADDLPADAANATMASAVATIDAA